MPSDAKHFHMIVSRTRIPSGSHGCSAIGRRIEEAASPEDVGESSVRTQRELGANSVANLQTNLNDSAARIQLKFPN